MRHKGEWKFFYALKYAFSYDIRNNKSQLVLSRLQGAWTTEYIKIKHLSLKSGNIDYFKITTLLHCNKYVMA